ncbi:cytochrome P450 [Rhizodiscina lignyota]|uniref:Cytochrome P450 n=1 Tax=Rhizodiscina lignyota TaxID=1504668 RepID=A0A9P4I8B5_9PEZI|nr:cytochrome P450 [Rhizodiscina lignyota]
MAPQLTEINLDRFANRSTLLLAIALPFLWILILRPIYLLSFHPLSRFPGPKLWAVTRWGVSLANISGRSRYILLDLHKKYGPVVRIAPDEITFQSITARTEIAGHRKVGEPEMIKEPVFNESFRNNIIGASRDDHARMRKILARGFAASTLQRQEPLIIQYIDKLISELHKRADGTNFDIEAWYAYTAFDIIGDLTFGESFGSLDSGGHSSWASLLFETSRTVVLGNSLKRISKALLPALLLITPKNTSRRMQENRELTDAKIAKRRALGTSRPDFMSGMLGDDGKGGLLSEDELKSNCDALMIAGAETTSTVLGGITYYMATTPSVLENAATEVRSTFVRDEDINMIGTAHLKYLQAVITETLRMLPPIAGISPRQVPAGGAVIAGEFIPEYTTVGVSHFSMGRAPEYFSRADEFHPERWLDGPLFKNDQKEAAQPFAVGPRNCVGMNLANVELRIIIARILWNFDLKLDESSMNWERDMNEYLAWEKAPLIVSLTPRQK